MGKKVSMPTRQSKIVKYKLENDCVNLRKAGLSYREIADELNASGKVPAHDQINQNSVARFLSTIPKLTKQLVKEDRSRLLQVVNTNFDIIHEINTLFGKTKTLLEQMEQEAQERNRIINPYQYKAVVSEMREMLKQMLEIQKEVNEFDNIRKFMEIVLQVIQEEAPEVMPIIARRLRMTKDTQWFADLAAQQRAVETYDA